MIQGSGSCGGRRRRQLPGNPFTCGGGLRRKIRARRGRSRGWWPRGHYWHQGGAPAADSMAEGAWACGEAARGHGGAVLCSHGARGEAARVGGCGWGSREAAGAIKGAGGDPGDAHREGRGARSPARCSAVAARGGSRRWQAGPTGQRRGVLRAAERASGRAGWLAPPGGVGLSGGARRLGRWRAGLRGMGRAERGQTGGEAGRGGAGPVSRVLGRAWAERNWAAGSWVGRRRGVGPGKAWADLGC